MSRLSKLLLLSFLILGQLHSDCLAGEPSENLRMRQADDPDLIRASTIARARWSEFASAFKDGTGLGYNVKAAFKDGVKTEHMWVEVKNISGTKIQGKLNSDPFMVTNIKTGAPVVLTVSQIEDWLYVDKASHDHGNFTAGALRNKERVK
jgi:uncharacterized protein YegJ (DUF2314 family)